MDKPVSLKITSGVAIDGVLHRADSIIEVPERIAVQLLERGKAVLADRAPEPAPEAPEAEPQPDETAPKKGRKPAKQSDEE